jgi:hypothetical protein
MRSSFMISANEVFGGFLLLKSSSRKVASVTTKSLSYHKISIR